MMAKLYRSKKDAIIECNSRKEKNLVVVKVEIVDPDTVYRYVDWYIEGVGDPLQDPFGAGEFAKSNFQKGEVGYLVGPDPTGKNLSKNGFSLLEIIQTTV